MKKISAVILIVCVFAAILLTSSCKDGGETTTDKLAIIASQDAASIQAEENIVQAKADKDLEIGKTVKGKKIVYIQELYEVSKKTVIVFKDGKTDYVLNYLYYTDKDSYIDNRDWAKDEPGQYGALNDSDDELRMLCFRDDESYQGATYQQIYDRLKLQPAKYTIVE